MTAAPAILTPAEARELLAPHVGAKLRRDRRFAIDVHAAGIVRRDASIRAVDQAGVTTFQSGANALETDPWGEIARIVVAALDEAGERVSEREYEIVADARRAA